MLLPALPVLAFLACAPDPNAPPPRPDGVLGVVEVETSEGVKSTSEAIAARHSGCQWGREVWVFAENRLTVQNDVLCPSKLADEAYGCQVRVTADASWDAERGVFTVPHSTAARARFDGAPNDDADPGLRTRCRVALPAGEYPVARIRNGQWKWEMRTPEGLVLRLDTSDLTADFGTAVRDVDGAKP